MKILRSILMFALLPLLVASCIGESEIPLSTGGHAVALALTVLIIAWLAGGLARLDEIDRLRNLCAAPRERTFHYASEREGTWRVHIETTAPVPAMKEEVAPRVQTPREPLPGRLVRWIPSFLTKNGKAI